MKIATKVLLLLLLVGVAASARKRDPLTEAEADQLRGFAMEPYQRIKLLIKFTEARLTSIDQVHADPKLAATRGKQIHDLLEDFTALLDEINDNLDQFQGRPLKKEDEKDFHKGLKELLEADKRFEAKLKALLSATENDPSLRKDLPEFRFVLHDAEDALKSTDDMAREYSETTRVEKKK
jgi:hypothetical protein